MYIEKRKVEGNIKYYLVHSYREKNEVKKIRKYLGINLSKEDLETRRKLAEQDILEILNEININVFLFSLTKNQIKILNRIGNNICCTHLSEDEWQRFTEEFVYNTNAIEGSTVSLNEVPKILRKKYTEDKEEIETKGVANAIDYIRKTKEGLSLDLILKLHKLCFEGSKHFAGKFRDVNVIVRNSRGEVLHTGVSKEQLNDYLADLIYWYEENKNKFKPLVLAGIIHNQFEHIHPFQDGNGRIGRLLLNFILLKNKYPPINIAFEDRWEYYSTLTEYSKNQNLKPTIEYLIKQYKKTLKEVTTEKKKM